MWEWWTDFWFSFLDFIPKFEPTWLWVICIILGIPIMGFGFFSPFIILGILISSSSDGWLSKKFPNASTYIFIAAIILLILIFFLIPDSGANRPPPEHPYDF